MIRITDNDYIEKIVFNMEVDFQDNTICDIIFQSLEVEAKYTINERAVASLEKSDSKLLLKIEALDSVSARAAINSYLKWVNLSLQILDDTNL